MNGKERQENLLGQELGWLTITRLHHRGRTNHWLCRCRCGQERIHTTNYLLGNKAPRSCGCNALTGIRVHQVKQSPELTGKRFNHLRVIEYWRKTSNGSYWECECVCGNRIYVRSSDLTKNKRQSCGCVRDARIVQLNRQKTDARLDEYKRTLIGTKIHRWTIQDVFLNQNRQTCVVVECDCGTLANRVLANLSNDHSKSCGCVQKDILRQHNEMRGQTALDYWKHTMIGKRYNKLTVKDVVKVEDEMRSVVICQCDCGNQVTAERYHVTSGKRKQCQQCRIKQQWETRRKQTQEATCCQSENGSLK